MVYGELSLTGVCGYAYTPYSLENKRDAASATLLWKRFFTCPVPFRSQD